MAMKKEPNRKTPAILAQQVLVLGEDSGVLGGKNTLPIIPAGHIVNEQPLHEPLRRPKAPRMGREKREDSISHYPKKDLGLVR